MQKSCGSTEAVTEPPNAFLLNREHHYSTMLRFPFLPIFPAIRRHIFASSRFCLPAQLVTLILSRILIKLSLAIAYHPQSLACTYPATPETL